MKNWGKATEVDCDSLKLIDLSKVKVKVEMNPNVVLLVLLEVIDVAWVFTIAITIIEGEGEVWRKLKLTRCKSESASMGDGLV